MRDTAKDRGKYVVSMGKCVVLCVEVRELCSCMLKGLLGRCEDEKRISEMGKLEQLFMFD